MGSPLTYKYSTFVFDNENANQGSQCSSVPTYTMVVHNVALHRLGGAQDDFACLFFMVYNAVLSVLVLSVCALLLAPLPIDVFVSNQ